MNPDLQGVHRIYISGPITGRAFYRARFEQMQEILEHYGFDVVNPAYNSMAAPNATHEEYMRICFAQMRICDAIVFLKGWEDSKGAKMEHDIAKNTNMKMFYE